jgi:hypothetical protein
MVVGMVAEIIQIQALVVMEVLVVEEGMVQEQVVD